MKTATLYRDILKKAFDVTFKNRIFWLLGLFAAPLIGIGEYRVISHGFGFVSEDWLITKWYPIVSTGVFQFETLRYLGRQFAVDPISVLILFIILAILLLFIFFIVWLAVVAQGALIDGIDQSSSKRLTGTKLPQFIATGINRFWPVIGIHLFVKILISIVLLLLSLPIIIIAIGGNSNAAGALYLIFVLILIPIAIIIAFTSKYAINYIVLEKNSFGEAIKKGWRLFADNWLISIEMAIILLFIALIFGIVITVIGSLVILPIGLFSYIVAQMGMSFLVKAIFVLGLLLLIILGIFVAAILSTFQYSCWVLLFNRLNSSKEKVMGKLARWFDF